MKRIQKNKINKYINSGFQIQRKTHECAGLIWKFFISKSRIWVVNIKLLPLWSSLWPRSKCKEVWKASNQETSNSTSFLGFQVSFTTPNLVKSMLLRFTWRIEDKRKKICAERQFMIIYARIRSRTREKACICPSHKRKNSFYQVFKTCIKPSQERK